MTLSEAQRSNLTVALREVDFLGEHLDEERREDLGSIRDRVKRVLDEEPAEHYGFECQGTKRLIGGELSFCGFVVKGDEFPDECPNCGTTLQDWAFLSYQEGKRLGLMPYHLQDQTTRRAKR